MKQCMKCYAENDEHYQICRACGSDKFVMKKESLVPCKYCGADTKEGDKECYSCHHPLD
jgi:RNA polymerase subunit RPABC4/transcription elongation factor Spt4